MNKIIIYLFILFENQIFKIIIFLYLNNIMKKFCITKMYLNKRNFNFLEKLSIGVKNNNFIVWFSNRGVCVYCYIIIKHWLG